MWAVELVHRKASLERDNLAASVAACSDNVTELAADANMVQVDEQLATQQTNSCSSVDGPSVIEMEKLPASYVAMRD